MFAEVRKIDAELGTIDRGGSSLCRLKPNPLLSLN